jgi:hypothetical protein
VKGKRKFRIENLECRIAANRAKILDNKGEKL